MIAITVISILAPPYNSPTPTPAHAGRFLPRCFPVATSSDPCRFPAMHSYRPSRIGLYDRTERHSRCRHSVHLHVLRHPHYLCTIATTACLFCSTLLQSWQGTGVYTERNQCDLDLFHLRLALLSTLSSGHRRHDELRHRRFRHRHAVEHDQLVCVLE